MTRVRAALVEVGRGVGARAIVELVAAVDALVHLFAARQALINAVKGRWAGLATVVVTAEVLLNTGVLNTGHIVVRRIASALVRAVLRA